jgi:diguanylate cyclase (GGDEF)-like protein
VCGTTQAAVNLVDAERVWPAAEFGTETGPQTRAEALCSHVVTGTDVVHVPDAAADPRFSGYPLVVSGAVRRYAAAPLVTEDGHTIGTLAVHDDQDRPFTEVQLSLLVDLAAQVVALFEMRWMAVSLSRVATRDPLTGLANRRSAEQAIQAAIARAERGLGTPSVVVVDIDDFAEVNEAFGRPAGDAVLRSVAFRLTRTARAVDTVGRLGGDEFVVLLESTGGPGATAALGRLRRSLEEAWGEITGGREVGASLGITTYRPGDSVASLIARADAEMYADKARRAAQRS